MSVVIPHRKLKVLILTSGLTDEAQQSLLNHLGAQQHGALLVEIVALLKKVGSGESPGQIHTLLTLLSDLLQFVGLDLGPQTYLLDYLLALEDVIHDHQPQGRAAPAARLIKDIVTNLVKQIEDNKVKLLPVSLLVIDHYCKPLLLVMRNNIHKYIDDAVKLKHNIKDYYQAYKHVTYALRHEMIEDGLRQDYLELHQIIYLQSNKPCRHLSGSDATNAHCHPATDAVLKKISFKLIKQFCDAVRHQSYQQADEWLNLIDKQVQFTNDEHLRQVHLTLSAKLQQITSHPLESQLLSHVDVTIRHLSAQLLSPHVQEYKNAAVARLRQLIIGGEWPQALDKVQMIANYPGFDAESQQMLRQLSQTIGNISHKFSLRDQFKSQPQTVITCTQWQERSKADRNIASAAVA